MTPGPSAKTPVIVTTGFLGSGKTTLLNAALRDPAFSDSAVVVNEFGEIALDHFLVSEGRERVVLTQAGCLCCAALDSLPETLADLFGRRARGEVPPFARVFIETTGLAEPGPILRLVMRDPIVSHFAALDGLICTIDARLGCAQLSQAHEAQVQAALADRLIVTKTELTGGAPVELLDALRRLNPVAEVLIKADASLAALMAPLAAHAQAALSGPAPELHDHAAHDAGVTSVSLWIDRSATWPGLAAWIAWARDRYGADLLRCKGLLTVGRLDGPVLVQGVQTLFETSRLKAWPDGERRSRLILIGRGLAAHEIEGSLALLGER